MTGSDAPDPIATSDLARLSQAQMLIEARRPDEAIRVMSDVVSGNPGDAQALATLGWAYLSAEDPGAAERWINAALAADPSDGWIHHLRAILLLQFDERAPEAVPSALFAARQDPSDEKFLYTLVRAQLAAGDRDDAAQTVQRLRRAAPDSHRGPLAEALVELDRSAVFRRKRYTVGGLILLAVVTRGLGLVIVGVGWAIHAVRRAPHLRRTDTLLQEALRIDPGRADVRTAAAQVLDLRFRFAQSVEYELAAAALDAGLVDGHGLAKAVARRTSIAIISAFFVWLAVVAVADEVITSEGTVAALGVSFGVLGLASVVGFERWQSSGLPPVLQRNVRRQIAPLAAAGFAVLWLAVAGTGYLGSGSDADAARGYLLACLLVSPLAVLSLLVLAVRVVQARWTRGRRSWPMWSLVGHKLRRGRRQEAR